MDAILQACAHILVRDGYESATTTKIADRAGVSIGSLYQYFPGREAVVAGLTERHAEILAMHVSSSLVPQLPLETGIRQFVRYGVSANRIMPQLHKVLTEQMPHIGASAVADQASTRITASLEHFLRARQHELNAEIDCHTAATMIQTCTEALVHKAVSEDLSIANDSIFEVEIVKMAFRYVDGRGS